MKILITLILTCAAAVAADPGQSLREASAKKAGQAPVVVGQDGWLFLPSELRHIGAGKFWGPQATEVSKATKPENADPLPAILDFKKQLDGAGVELILVPVPGKAFVYPEAILGGETTGAAPRRADDFQQEFFEELRKNGITVVDLLPDFLAQRHGPKGPVFCRQDTHWSGAGIVLAAEKITLLLKDKPWLIEAHKIGTQTAWKEIEITGDLWGMLPTDKPAKEKLQLRFVGTTETGGVQPVLSAKESPVVLLGDSHALIFHTGGDMLATGAGLADQLASDLGIPIDVIGVRGSGATPARVNLLRRIRADPSYLSGKKALIWCFTVREFTESTGWSVLPLQK